MKKPLFLLSLAAALALPVPTAAARDEIFVSLRADQPLNIQDGHAYILFRVERSAGISWTKPVFMQTSSRIPDIRGFNLQDVHGKPYRSVAGTDFYLVDVPPGDYVFYGIAYGNGLGVCNCLGTVGFAAEAGQVVDIGTYLADVAHKKSDVPELAGESGFGPSIYGTSILAVATLRPAGPNTPQMPGLDPKSVVAADFQAIGPYANAGAPYINRLAPIPGVLAYDSDGRVMDVKRNKEAPPRLDE